MSNSFFDDPLPDHLADTGPIQTIRDGGRGEPLPAWRRAFGLLSLMGATVLTAGAVFITIGPTPTPEPPVVPSQPAVAQEASPVPATATPAEDTTANLTIQDVVNAYAALPTLDPARINEMLAGPVQAAPTQDTAAVRNIYEPFTIIPERSRSGVEPYTIASGDTIFSLAERYGLQPETIVWGNDHTLVEGLRPGRIINILPVDGVYHVADGDETIAQIAAQYRVEPYDIIDSEFNDLFGMNPDSVPPEGTEVVVPGGEREQISWNPTVERVPAGAAGTSGANGAISFAPGEPGSCGLVTNPGGTVWVPPLHGYQWIRGFSGVHSGVDLSAPAGTPVSAANGGSVIFAGWNNYGYGYAVVLAHGPYTTLYGHLSSISVGCAQYVQAGDIIGAVGSSGQSSGPHLHFEIRYLDTPTDPTATMPF